MIMIHISDKKQNELDLYSMFSLEPDSAKSLYVNIESNNNDLTEIVFDVSKEKINKKLPLNVGN